MKLLEQYGENKLITDDVDELKSHAINYEILRQVETLLVCNSVPRDIVNNTLEMFEKNINISPKNFMSLVYAEVLNSTKPSFSKKDKHIIFYCRSKEANKLLEFIINGYYVFNGLRPRLILGWLDNGTEKSKEVLESKVDKKIITFNYNLIGQRKINITTNEVFKLDSRYEDDLDFYPHESKLDKALSNYFIEDITLIITHSLNGFFKHKCFEIAIIFKNLYEKSFIYKEAIKINKNNALSSKRDDIMVVSNLFKTGIKYEDIFKDFEIDEKAVFKDLEDIEKKYNLEL